MEKLGFYFTVEALAARSIYISEQILPIRWPRAIFRKQKAPLLSRSAISSR